MDGPSLKSRWRPCHPTKNLEIVLGCLLSLPQAPSKSAARPALFRRLRSRSARTRAYAHPHHTSDVGGPKDALGVSCGDAARPTPIGVRTAQRSMHRGCRFAFPSSPGSITDESHSTLGV